MPQDAFTLRYVIKELDEKLRGGKISRINQPEKDELTIFIYTKSGTVKLEICACAQNCRLNIGGAEKNPPKSALSFCMLLRKYLQNAQLMSVRQIEFERIAAFDFDCVGDFERANRTLYCEIMGKYSNVVLTENGRILGAMKTTSLESGAHRILFSGAQYTLPQPQDKADPRNLAALEKVIENLNGDAARFISANVTGISYTTAIDIERMFGAKPSAKNIFDYVSGKFYAPCVTFCDGMPSDFKACSCSDRKKPYPSVLEAQSAYYDYVCRKKAFDDKKRMLEGALRFAEKKCEKRLSTILSRLEECNDLEDIKLKGELITANIYAIERGADSLKAVNYYDENLPVVTITLDPLLTPAQNAQKYFKRYAKLKRTFAALSVQKEQTQSEKSYLESIRFSIEGADDLLDFEEAETELKETGILKSCEPSIKKKKQEAAPYRKYLFEGYTILAGRNNVQNDRLTKSLCEKDLWLHAQRCHSCHAAIIYDGREFSDSAIKIAAEICAYYSEGRLSGKVNVDYAYKKFVKKPSGAKAGFVVYTDYKTAVAIPDKHQELLKENYEKKE